MTAPSVFRISEIADRFENLEEGGTFIKAICKHKRSVRAWLVASIF